MAWDFSTDPEFQEQLDGVEKFCPTEIEPLDLATDPELADYADTVARHLATRG